MPSLVVIGSQWGDEGKGKLVDYLTSGADAVVRFQGGNNAGHTLVVDGKTTKLHLVPSGILREKILCIIAAGVVLNPEVFAEELQALAEAGIAVGPERLLVDRDTHLILPYHVALDHAREIRRGKEKIGTTGRGIGPCYEDRASRCGVRVADLLQLDLLLERVRPLVEEKNRVLKEVLGSDSLVAFEEVEESLRQAKSLLSPFIGNASLTVEDLLRRQKKVVFEGAQGALLDQMHGTIPFVTSSNTLSGAACTGVGIGPKLLDHVLGVTKAYCTRVGTGPFPTEETGDFADELRTRGGEFGTTTGRARRVGWFDAVLMKRAVRLNGIDSLALTKLDVLTGVEKIRVCVKYSLDGVELDDVPALAGELERVQPHYVDFDGWEEPIDEVQKWHHLPANARFYLSTLAEIVGCPVSIVSVGPERSATLFSSVGSFERNFVGE